MAKGGDSVNENAKAWVAALRSGEYRQNRTCRHKDGTFSALSVAVDLYIKAGHDDVVNVERDDGWVVSANADGSPKDGCLPQAVAKWLGLRSGGAGWYAVTPHRTAMSVAYLEDDRELSFSAIADFVETEPPGLFEEGSDDSEQPHN